VRIANFGLRKQDAQIIDNIRDTEKSIGRPAEFYSPPLND